MKELWQGIKKNTVLFLDEGNLAEESDRVFLVSLEVKQWFSFYWTDSAVSAPSQMRKYSWVCPHYQENSQCLSVNSHALCQLRSILVMSGTHYEYRHKLCRTNTETHILNGIVLKDESLKWLLNQHTTFSGEIYWAFSFSSVSSVCLICYFAC